MKEPTIQRGLTEEELIRWLIELDTDAADLPDEIVVTVAATDD